MTNQMVEPTETIDKNVRTLCDDFQTLTMEETEQMYGVIKTQSEAIVSLLDQQLQAAQKADGKEDGV